MSKQNAPQVITAGRLRLVDAEGRERMVLSVDGGLPTLSLLRENGELGAHVGLDAQGLGAVKLSGAGEGGPGAKLEIDGKGAHVKFDRAGGASAYLFLNNAGGSGVVLIDAAGQRRITVSVAADGSSRIERHDDPAPGRG